MKETTLLDAQEDLYQRTLADEYLANVAILKRDDGDINADIADALGVLNKRAAGKIGACVIVLQPIARPAPAEVIGGLLEIDFTFLVFEDPVLNKDATNGTLKRALAIARRLVAIHTYYHPRGVIGCLTMQQQAIVPIEESGAPVAYEVRFSATESFFTNTIRVGTPTIAPNGGAVPQLVTLACATAGAAIYYTLDGSHPHAGNGAAQLYAAPFNVNAAATLRVGAFKAGLIGSDIQSADFT